MGPWTRGFRILFSAAFGALAGFLLWMVASSVVWHQVAQRRHYLFEDLMLLAFIGGGAVIGGFLGWRLGRDQHHD